MQVTNSQHITIQVLPHSAGSHAGLNGPFVIFGFAGERDPDTVCLENLTGTLYLEHPGELAGYAASFDHLRASALNPADSLALIQQVAKSSSHDLVVSAPVSLMLGRPPADRLGPLHGALGMSRNVPPTAAERPQGRKPEKTPT
ncbi:Scr1 family TA system antitoxin-like transcriptional regulator [Streptomyces polygonati]|uniref:Scr1 family TA system antitoxin-like transcriptional regulator n=1 Tax=Streptomyces polygonati TaxID=1617087 RepID=A0ABV8HJG1_9ACTN